MTVIVTLDRLSHDLIMETEDIIAENYAETSHFHEPLDINWDMYMALGVNFKAFTMRADGRMVGVLFFAIDRYPHVKTLMMAQQLTFYVTPQYRKHSLEMIRLSEDYFKDHDIDIIIQNARYDTGFCNVLDAKGYTRADITYTKRIS
jgi:hypothetical protein